MASGWYERGKAEIAKANVDLDAAGTNVRVVLMRTSTYTVNLATHASFADLVSPSHTRGAGALIANKTVDNNAVFDGDDALLTSVAAGAAYNCAAVYMDSGTDATSFLLIYIDGFTVTPDGGNISVVWAAASPKIGKL